MSSACSLTADWSITPYCNVCGKFIFQSSIIEKIFSTDLLEADIAIVDSFENYTLDLISIVRFPINILFKVVNGLKFLEDLTGFYNLNVFKSKMLADGITDFWSHKFLICNVKYSEHSKMCLRVFVPVSVELWPNKFPPEWQAHARMEILPHHQPCEQVQFHRGFQTYFSVHPSRFS